MADDLRPEYDLSKLKGGVRGKYSKETKMGSDLSSQNSICRASVLLKQPAVESDYVILKLIPDPKGCCCFHCWPETWSEINKYIVPNGPIQDEGDTVINFKGGQYVLECHESGPEIVIYLATVTALLAFSKSVVDLITTFLKARVQDRHKPISRVNLSWRRILHGRVEDEVLIEIDLPLKDDVVKLLNEKIRRKFEHSAQQSAPVDTNKRHR